MTRQETGAGVARAHVDVQADPDAAFAAFVAVDGWWPPEFTWSGDALAGIAIAPAAGGLCSEWGPHGFRVDWGRVLRWEPPRALTLSWQIGPDRTPRPDPADATRVDVAFAPAGGGTRVTVEHSGFDRPGAGGDPYRAAMAEQGWPHLLERFAASVPEALDR